MGTLPNATQLATWLDALTSLGGLSGYEYPVRAYMAETLRPWADAVHTDPLGNLIARFGPERAEHRLAVLAHMDTVGLMITQILPDGMLRVVQVGGVNVRALSGAAVEIWHTPTAADVPQLPGVTGVIGVRSQHLARAGEAPPSVEALYVQIAPEDAARVRITAPVTYAPQHVRQGAHLYSSPHLDDRAGCAALLALGEWLGQRGVPTSDTAIYLVGTVQEETTCAGALHALQAIRPRAAIFVDGTLSYDTPDTRGRGSVLLGAGPVLNAFLYVSGLNGWHADPHWRARLRRVAETRDIPYQEDAIRGLMSDARAALWAGVPSVMVGVPMRGKHAPLETVHLGDLTHAARLLIAAATEWSEEL